MSQKEKGDVNMFTLTIILLGVFPALGIIFYIGAATLMRVDTVFNIVVICGLAAFLVHIPFLKKWNRYLAEIIGYSLFGWGLIITSLFMGINYLIHSQPVTDAYKIENAVAHPEERELPFPVSVTLKDENTNQENVPASAYNDYSGMLRFSGEEQKFNGVPKTAKMTTATGLFGYRVLLGKELD